MHPRSIIFVAVAVFASNLAQGQSFYPYILTGFAGSYPLGDGGPAKSALLAYPSATIAAPDGSLYVMDAGNYRIRQIAPDGTISTVVRDVVHNDMKLGPDGSLYYIGSFSRIFKLPKGGSTPQLVAGGFTAQPISDGSVATSGALGIVSGLAIDRAGNVYVAEDNRIRKITADGIIRTFAGGTSFGSSGDGGPAANALLYQPSSIAFDGSGNLFVADYFNGRIRKIAPNGIITTFVGGGFDQLTKDGQAPLSYAINARYLNTDPVGNLDAAVLGAIVKITPAGVLTRITGQYQNACCVYGDGRALDATLGVATGLSADATGNIYFTDQGFNLSVVRKVTPAGDITTISGRPHFYGDGGKATSAILNGPELAVADGRGNVFIYDKLNSRIRKVDSSGIISTVAGNAASGNVAVDGSLATSAPIGLNDMVIDGGGNIYYAAGSTVRKISADGFLSTVAGTGIFGDSGDGGPAKQATFKTLNGIALGPDGSLFVADSTANRVRRINLSTGQVTAWAGTGAQGYSGDGGSATLATLRILQTGFRIPLATDPLGNLFIGDAMNAAIRKVSPSGGISTVAGNGSFGVTVSGKAPTQIPFLLGFAVDKAGDLYFSGSTSDIFRIHEGIAYRIYGSGSGMGSPTDTPDPSTGDFESYSISIDGNGDLYLADPMNSSVRRLIYDSPQPMEIAGGDGQVGRVGQKLVHPLAVRVRSRSGAGVAGLNVSFTITSGAGTLERSNVITDADGVARVSSTLGASPGPVVVSAVIFGANPSGVQFNLTAVPIDTACAIAPPTVLGVRSASAFGAFLEFAAGSWIEITGENLAGTTREWTGDDFNGSNAPTSLSGTSATINGKNGFVYYVSPTQVNVQVPSDSFTGMAAITVRNCAGTSTPIQAPEVAISPGILAPYQFKVSGTQYAAALFSDNTTFVGSPGFIAGVTSKPAKAGDKLTLYGVGFGQSNPGVPAGTIANGLNTVPNVGVSFGGVAGAVTYAGFAPGLVGLYQINVTVPTLPANGPPEVGVSVSVGGQAVQQTMVLTMTK